MKTTLTIFTALAVALSFGGAGYFLWFYLTIRSDFGFILASATMAFFGVIGAVTLWAIRRVM